MTEEQFKGYKALAKVCFFLLLIGVFVYYYVSNDKSETNAGYSNANNVCSRCGGRGVIATYGYCTAPLKHFHGDCSPETHETACTASGSKTCPCCGGTGKINSNLNERSTSETYKNHEDPQIISQTTDDKMIAMDTLKKDSTELTIKPVKQNFEQKVDSIELLQEVYSGEKYGYQLTNKLPVSYVYRNLKFTFCKLDTSINVKCYDSGELYNTYICKVDNNNILLNTGDGFFSFSGGKLTLVFPEKHIKYPLSMAKSN